jgi:hypothetical protein
MSDFPQIAKNPSLGDWYLKETKIDHQYKTVVIEEAFNWEYVFIPGLEHSKGEHPDHIDYNRIPQSLHYDEGMKITWGWMLFQSGYRQSIPVKQGQRYTAVAKFTGDIRDTQDQTAIQWQFFVAGLQSATSEWSAYSHANQFNTPTEHQFVFQASEDGWIDLTFWAKTVWADNAGELRVRSIEVFEVPPDYGMAFPVVPYPNDDQHPGPGDDEPEPETPTAPTWLLPVMLAVCGIILAVIIYGILKPRLAAQVSGVHEMEQAFAQLVSWIIQTANVDGLPFAIALGTLLTGLTKMALVNVPKKYQPSGQLTALVWQVVIWAFWMATRQVGFEEQFMVFGTNFTPIVIMVVNSLLGTKFQSVIYDRYLATKVSIAGYQRTPNRSIPPAQ